MAVGAVVARILTQYSDKGSKAATKDINKLGKSFDRFAKKSAKAFGLAAAASAAFAVKIGKDAVQAALADQKSQALLANSLRNTVGASDAQIVSVEKNITALQKQFNVVDDELRPAFGNLTAAFGSTTAASSALQLALDISADKGVDLATASDAIIKASRGQTRALGNLVKGIDAGVLASKDFGKITEEVARLTGGAAATRAKTLESRMIGLKIAFGEVLETLGYALLPVLEKFATMLTTQILPKVEAFVALNKDKLAAGFAVAADMAFKLLTTAVAFSNWCINNMGIVKTMAAIIAGMFVVGRIAAFATAIQGLIVLMTALAASSTAAAIATALATGGSNLVIGAAAIAASTYLVVKKNTGGGNSTTPADRMKQRGSRVQKDFSAGTTGALPKASSALDKFTSATKAATAASKDQLINEAAAKKNLIRQAELSKTPTIITGSGRLSMTSGNVSVAVYSQNLVSTKEDLVTQIIDGIERSGRRSFGSGGGGRFSTQLVL